MKVVSIALFMAFISLSCQTSPVEKAHLNGVKGVGKSHSEQNIANNTPAKKTQNTDWEEYSEEDISTQFAIDQALITVRQALKTGSLRAMVVKTPLCLVMTRGEGKCEIGLYKLLSKPLNKPAKLGERLEFYQFSGVLFPEKERYFWYDAKGNVDFTEPDKVLNTLHPPLEADITLFPIAKNNPRVGMIDINKEKTKVYCNQYILQSNHS